MRNAENTMVIIREEMHHDKKLRAHGPYPFFQQFPNFKNKIVDYLSLNYKVVT